MQARLIAGEDSPRQPEAVPGPGDLAGRTGTLVLSGAPSNDHALAAWTLALGAFVLRGGEIRWRAS